MFHAGSLAEFESEGEPKHNRQGESWPNVGPKKQLLWLTSGADGVFVLSPALVITPGVPIGRLNALLAVDLFGKGVLNLETGEPTKVAVVSWREW